MDQNTRAERRAKRLASIKNTERGADSPNREYLDLRADVGFLDAELTQLASWLWDNADTTDESEQPHTRNWIRALEWVRTLEGHEEF